MRALTIYQPCAPLIARGAKRYEFRRWAGVPALFGQRIAIHASVRKPRQAEIDDMLDRIAANESFLRREAAQILEGVAPAGYPLGAIVATAQLEESLSPAQVRRLAGGNDSGRDEHYNWAWPLSDVRIVEPVIPIRGRQGFWPIGEDALELVELRERRGIHG